MLENTHTNWYKLIIIDDILDEKWLNLFNKINLDCLIFIIDPYQCNILIPENNIQILDNIKKIINNK